MPLKPWLQVPYEELPFLFFGEEQYMLAKMWTRGWDMFAPPRSIAFHQWTRKGRNAFQACVPQVGLKSCSCKLPLTTLVHHNAM
jgi:hypothetical protein